MQSLGHYRIDQGLREKVNVMVETSGKLSVRVVGYIIVQFGMYGHLGQQMCDFRRKD